ncbi:hypothetical protein SORBI_3009G076550 [Sorghum bicolor]|uniref:Uncharacterized protein n=1 Tax=Sorghum bicolor TaxID=4558 RepID=A0A1Z5R2E4_SORBI|nr:hypothetical protein SORBI_3009G076550 [Sorghum bicolor]
MASSHKIVFVLLLLIASSSMLEARVVRSDRRRHARADQAHVKESVPNPSQDTEIAVAKRWGTTQADGSVPSPGIGHQQILQ